MHEAMGEALAVPPRSATVIYIFILCSSLLFLEFVIGFALRSGSVLGTLPEGECEAGTPIHM